jgi:hypothetical protein
MAKLARGACSSRIAQSNPTRSATANDLQSRYANLTRTLPLGEEWLVGPPASQPSCQPRPARNSNAPWHRDERSTFRVSNLLIANRPDRFRKPRRTERNQPGTAPRQPLSPNPRLTGLSHATTAQCLDRNRARTTPSAGRNTAQKKEAPFCPVDQTRKSLPLRSQSHPSPANPSEPERRCHIAALAALTRQPRPARPPNQIPRLAKPLVRLADSATRWPCKSVNSDKARYPLQRLITRSCRPRAISALISTRGEGDERERTDTRIPRIQIKGKTIKIATVKTLPAPLKFRILSTYLVDNNTISQGSREANVLTPANAQFFQANPSRAHPRVLTPRANTKRPGHNPTR